MTKLVTWSQQQVAQGTNNDVGLPPENITVHDGPPSTAGTDDGPLFRRPDQSTIYYYAHDGRLRRIPEHATVFRIQGRWYIEPPLA